MRKVIKLLIDVLLKKNIIRFSRIEDSFFLYKKLDKKIKLDKNIININYNKESPYGNNSTITYIIDKNNLYLWFNKSEISYNYLPEAYVLFRKLSLEYKDIIFIIKDKIDKIIVIKNSILVSSFSKSKLLTKDLILLKEEFGLDNILIIEKREYEEYLLDSFQYLKLNDILNILNIKIDYKEYFTRVIFFLALPIFVSSVIITIILGIYSFYLNKDKDKLYEFYKKNQKLNYKLKKNIDIHEQKNMLYTNLANEFKYADKIIAFSEILRTTNDLNMSIRYIRMYEDNINFVIKTDNNNLVPIYIKKLFQSNLFEDIKNINTRKIKEKLEVTMNAKLKEKI